MTTSTLLFRDRTLDGEVVRLHLYEVVVYYSRRVTTWHADADETVADEGQTAAGVASISTVRIHEFFMLLHVVMFML